MGERLGVLALILYFTEDAHKPSTYRSKLVILNCWLWFARPLLLGSDVKETTIFTALAERSISVALENSAWVSHGVRGKRK